MTLVEELREEIKQLKREQFLLEEENHSLRGQLKSMKNLVEHIATTEREDT